MTIDSRWGVFSSMPQERGFGPSGDARRSDDPLSKAANKQAWLKEVERLQMGQWFNPFAAQTEPLNMQGQLMKRNGRESWINSSQPSLRNFAEPSPTGSNRDTHVDAGEADSDETLSSHSRFVQQQEISAADDDDAPVPDTSMGTDAALGIREPLPQPNQVLLKGGEGNGLSVAEVAPEVLGSNAPLPASAGDSSIPSATLAETTWQSSGELTESAANTGVPQAVERVQILKPDSVASVDQLVSGTNSLYSESRPTSRALEPNGRMPPISVPRRLPGTLPSSSLGLPTVVEAEQTDQITTPSTESAHWLRDILAARSGATYPTEMSSSPPGTRMHVLWEESGVALWLGMDGRSTEVASRVSVIVQALDRVLRAQGLRLSRVICNGTDVTDSEHGASALFDMPGEKPSRAVSTGY